MKRWRRHLDDLDQEIRDHIEAETRDNVARGMQEDDARAAALRKFGNITRVKEEARDVWVVACCLSIAGAAGGVHRSGQRAAL